MNYRESRFVRRIELTKRLNNLNLDDMIKLVNTYLDNTKNNYRDYDICHDKWKLMVNTESNFNKYNSYYYKPKTYDPNKELLLVRDNYGGNRLQFNKEKLFRVIDIDEIINDIFKNPNSYVTIINSQEETA